MIALRLAVFTALATGLVAQVPFDHLIVLESRSAAPEVAFRFVDPIPGGGVTVLRNQRVFVPTAGVAVDPDDGGAVFFSTQTSSLPGIWRKQLRYESEVQNTWGNWARNAVGALAVGSVDVVYAPASGGLSAIPKAGGTERSLTAGANYLDIAVDGTVAFAMSDLGDIVRVDLTSGALTPLAQITNVTCIGILDPTHVIVGTATGDILTLDRTTGTRTARVQTGKGPLVSIAGPEFGLPVFATRREVWSLIDLQTPLYVADADLLDIDISRDDRATVQRFGDGCGAPGQTPEQQVSGVPALSNAAFAARATSGPPNAPATLLIGGSRTFSNLLGTALPLDLSASGLPGCRLLVDPAADVGAQLDASGAVTVPLPIPASPSLRSTRLYAQWLALDPSSAGGVALSDGAAWQLR